MGLGAMWRRCCSPATASGPWLGFLVAIPVSAACGASSAFWLFASASRRFFRHPHHCVRRVRRASASIIWISYNTSAALFLPVTQYTYDDLWLAARQSDDVLLRDTGCDGGRVVLSRLSLRSRIGYFWLAIREDEAGGACRRHRYVPLKDVRGDRIGGRHVVRGVFYAFFYNNLFPEQVFSITQSIEMILGPIIGGVGTLFGPIVGAFVLTGLAGVGHLGDVGVRPRPARRQADFLWDLSADRGRCASGRHLAVAGASARVGERNR